MKTYKSIIVLSLFVMLMGFSPRAWSITKDDVMTLVSLKVPPGQIIKTIKKDRSVFHLTIQDILKLKRKGVAESVLRFMLSTPQRYGSGNAGVKGVKKTTKAKPHVKTALELQKEEAARKLEDRRKAMAERKRMQAQRKMMNRNITKHGVELAEDGDWVEAIRTFRTFLKSGNYQKGSPEYYNSTYGMAVAFARGGLAQSAARMFLEVLLMGSDKPFFKESFLELRKLRKEIDYSPTAMEKLTSFDVSGFSESFQDAFHYVLGEYFANYGNYQRALTFFNSVSDKSKDKPKALYLTGLVQIQHKMYRSAIGSFETAINLAETLNAPQEIIDLSYLAMARIAYENGNYDAAIYYYKKVPKTSLSLSRSFYELAWTYLMKLDYSRALGIFHALHSPFFKHSLYPDLWLLESRVYTDLCHYNRANAALREFDNKITVLLPKIKTFLAAQRRPQDFFTNFVKAADAPAKTAALPEIVIYKVISDIGFYNIYKTLNEIKRERKLLKENASAMGSVGTGLQTKLAQLYEDKQLQAGIAIQRLLRKVDDSIGDAMVNETEIQVDLNSAAMEKLQIETARLAGESIGVKKKNTNKRSAVIGNDQEVWNWDGDYWWDELSYYRGFVKDQCIKYAR